MSKQVKEDDETPLFTRLSFLSIKLRGISFLIEHQADEDHPNDYEQVVWGIGMILNDIASEMKTIANAMDGEAMAKERKSRKSST